MLVPSGYFLIDRIRVGGVADPSSAHDRELFLNAEDFADPRSNRFRCGVSRAPTVPR